MTVTIFSFVSIIWLIHLSLNKKYDDIHIKTSFIISKERGVFLRCATGCDSACSHVVVKLQEMKKIKQQLIKHKDSKVEMYKPIVMVPSFSGTREFINASFSSNFTKKIGLRIDDLVDSLVYHEDSHTFFWSAGKTIRKFTIGHADYEVMFRGDSIMLFLNLYKGVLFYRCFASGSHFIARIRISTGRSDHNWYETMTGHKIFHMTIGGDLLCLIEGDYEQSKLICSKLPSYQVLYTRKNIGGNAKVAVSHSMGKAMLIWSVTNKLSTGNDAMDVVRIELDTKKEVCHERITLSSKSMPVLFLHKSVLYYSNGGTKRVNAMEINMDCTTSGTVRFRDYPLPVQAPEYNFIVFAFL